MSYKESLKNKIIIEHGVEAIIFDCDGTLVDSMPTHMKAWEYAFNYFSAEYDEEFLFSLKGMKDTDIVDLYNKNFGAALNAEELTAIKSDYFIRHLTEIEPINPVIDVAKSNYKKLPLAVASGSPENIVYAELDFIGITGLFDVILTAGDPFTPKPDPEIFLAAASKMKVEPERCIVLEDGDAGLEAAVKASMKTFDVRTLFIG